MASQFLSKINPALRSEIKAVEPEESQTASNRARLESLSQAISAEAARFMTAGQVVDLEEILGRLPEPDAMRLRAIELTEHILLHCAGHGALVQILGPGQYYLAFPNLDEVQAELRSLAIVSELCRVLREELAIENQLSYKLDCMSLGADGRVTRRAAQLPRGGQRLEDYATVRDQFRKKVLAERLSRKSGNHRPPSQTYRKGEEDLDVVDISDPDLPSLAPESSPKSAESDLEIEAELRLVAKAKSLYAPIWRLEKRMVVGALMEPDLSFSPVLERGYGHVRRSWRSINPLARLDERQVLNLLDLLRERKPDQKGLLILPIHYSTLNNHYLFSDLQAAMEEVVTGDRAALVIEITGIPGDIAVGRLEKQIEMLKPLARGVILTLSENEVTSDLIDLLVKLPVEGVGLRLEPVQAVLPHEIGMSSPTGLAAQYNSEQAQREQEEERLLRLLSRLAIKTRQQNLYSFVWLVRNQMQAALCIASNIGYISGSAIAESMQEPPPLQSFAHSTRFRKLMAYFTENALRSS